MKEWVRFDFDSLVHWPQKDRKVIIRYVAQGNVRYSVETWYKTFPNRERNDYIRVHTYFSEYNEVKLYHDDENVLPLHTCFLTHWCYLDEPMDEYWKAYKHENGNTYTDKPWLSEQKPFTPNMQNDSKENINIEQLI